MTSAEVSIYTFLAGTGSLTAICLGSTFLVNALFRTWWAGLPLLAVGTIWAMAQPYLFPYALPALAITLGATYLLRRWGYSSELRRLTTAAEWISWGVVVFSIFLFFLSLGAGVYVAKTRHYSP